MKIETYGLGGVPEGTTQASIELMLAFDRRLFAAAGWLGRFQHLRNAIDLIWNIPRRLAAERRGQPYDVRKHDALIWNEWTEEMMRLFCEYSQRTVTGPNASWKTTSSAVYHLCAWYASPADTAVIVTSNTIPGLRRRIWKEILKYHRLAGSPLGNVVQSDIALQFRKGDMDAGIYGVAMGQDGDVDKIVNKIIGVHNTHVYACVDEMQTTHDAIVKAAVSLEAGAERFEFTGLGNADSELDPHGQMSEPVGGWDSIAPESDFWLTKRGACLHLDGLESPRVKEGDEFYPGLLRQADIDSTIRDYGEDSPEFWRGRRGFWAPQGVTKTVISSVMITKFRAKEKSPWVGTTRLVAGLDPAFEGGDRCILRIGKVGEIDDMGRIFDALELGEIIPIKVSAKSEEPLHYQIQRMVKDICEAKGIGPEMFAMDVSGEGGGLASIFIREWSSQIMQVEFGGRPSNRVIRPAGPGQPKPKLASDEYYNRVTELWYGFRTLMQNWQVRGLDMETAIEFCQRRYKMVGNLRQVEPKGEMKARTKRSPDLADAVAVMCELCAQKDLLSTLAGTGAGSTGARENWGRLAREMDVASDPDAYLVSA